jgi:ribosomal protein L18
MVGAHATKPYVLRLNISLKNISALVIHRPTRRCTASASSLERNFKETLAESGESARTIRVAHRVGALLAERLYLKTVAKVHLNLEKEAVKHGRESKRYQAFIDGLQENGIEILP